MTILIGSLLTLCILSLLIPFILPVVLFTIVVTRTVLWLCPALRKHMQEQATLYDIIEIEPYIEVGDNDMPEVVLWGMVDKE